ncbi:MAG: restriction endonuclease [Winogradskyella sp.]|nr:restriction endonuclease [Winogradskyella sp.]
MNTEIDAFKIYFFEYLKTLPKTSYEAFWIQFIETLGFTYVRVTENLNKNQLTLEGIINLGIVVQYFYFLVELERSALPIDLIKTIRDKARDYVHKGLLISLKTFNREVKKQAKRKGQLPIDLIDGDNLIGRLVQLRLGVVLNEKKLCIDKEWFNALEQN